MWIILLIYTVVLPNSGSSTTSTAIPAAYPHFPPHVYQSHQKMPWHNSNPFVIVPINNRIKKCAGCPFEFLDASGPTFTGLVVRHCEKDFYIDKTGHRMVGRETNRYYHCENGCLLNRHPYFSAALIRLEPGLQLNSFQLNHLQRALHACTVPVTVINRIIVFFFFNKWNSACKFIKAVRTNQCLI